MVNQPELLPCNMTRIFSQQQQQH